MFYAKIVHKASQWAKHGKHGGKLARIVRSIEENRRIKAKQPKKTKMYASVIEMLRAECRRRKM